MRGGKQQSADVNGSRTTITVIRNSSVPRSAFSGLCDCLRQPRKIRPLPFKAKDQEMVETRPGRLIRVVHLLPNKRVRKAKSEAVSANINGGNHNNYCSPKSSEPKVVDVPAAEILPRLTVHASADVADENENDEEENNSLDGDDERFNFSPVYGFENPFHPKNFLCTEEDDIFKVHHFANRLATTIVDDALLELGTLWRLILPSNSNNCKFRYSEENNGECYFLDDEFDDVNYRTWSSCTGGGFQRNGSLEIKFPRNSFRNNWEVNNGVFDIIKETDGFSLTNGGNGFLNFSNYKYPSSSSPLPSRSSFRSCNGYGRHDSKSNISKTLSWNRNHVVEDFEIGGGDQAFRRHELSSQPSTSFQSSIWGSSANSSLRYIRRFTSRRFKTKPLVCFIHGIGDSADLWRRQLEFFQERGYETVAWDLIGHGLSSAPDKPKSYTFDAILTDILALFDRYSRDRNVIVAHSYGCCFAAALARMRSKQVAHLILISGGGPFPLYPHPQQVRLPACFIDCFRALKSCGTRREMFYVPYRKQMRPMTGFDLPSYVIKHMIRGQVWLEGDASFHKQITIPTLLIYGLKDPYVNLVEECEMEKTIPRAFLELIPEASHMVMQETPDQVNDMMYKFLRRWNR